METTLKISWVNSQTATPLEIFLSNISSGNMAVFKLVEMQSIEMSLLWGLGYADVSVTHSGVDTLCN